MISIHALAKRATYKTRFTCGVCQYFNPRPRKEGDKLRVEITIRIIYFNPRPRKEGDL